MFAFVFAALPFATQPDAPPPVIAEASPQWYHDQLGFTIVKSSEVPNQHVHAKPRTGAAVETHGIFKVGFHAKDIPLRSSSIRDNDGNLIRFFGK